MFRKFSISAGEITVLYNFIVAYGSAHRYTL